MEMTKQELQDLLKAIEYTHRFYTDANRPSWLEDRIPRLMLVAGKLREELSKRREDEKTRSLQEISSS
jgi:hypothetical protein